MVVVAILAAGRGTRMKSNLPKVLHSLGGKSLVERVIQSVEPLQPERRMVIVGYQAQEVKTALQPIPDLEFVEQTVQLGTGHAIQQLLPHLKGYNGDLLILNGDVPLLRSETLKHFLEIHQENQNAATVLKAKLPNPKGYGRVFCDDNNVVQQIVEDPTSLCSIQRSIRILSYRCCNSGDSRHGRRCRRFPRNWRHQRPLTIISSLRYITGKNQRKMDESWCYFDRLRQYYH